MEMAKEHEVALLLLVPPRSKSGGLIVRYHKVAGFVGSPCLAYCTASVETGQGSVIKTRRNAELGLGVLRRGSCIGWP